ncbi:hypothetical protein BANRA_00475 [Acinetobacter baumannii]|nr:hypothetical protein BANRA_00475 [Acinetobacter baumannii]
MSNVMTTEEIVIVENDKPLTTSLHIADGSRANHKAVMQLIKHIFIISISLEGWHLKCDPLKQKVEFKQDGLPY